MRGNKEIHDVMVVGAGPAGATAARELAKGGYDVVLVDQSRFPRDKICGGLVPVKALNELDFHIPSCYIKNEIKKISIYNDSLAYSSYEKDKLLGITISRIDFDNHLLNRAIGQGVRFYEKTQFHGLEMKEEYMKVFTSTGIIYCKKLIGGDGIFSRVKKYIGNKGKIHKYGMGFTLRAYVDIGNKELHNDFKLFSVPVPCSMGWAIPCGSQVNIGIGGPWIRKKQLWMFFEEYIKKLEKIYSFDSSNIKIKGGILPAGGLKRKIIHKNILLVGDAAGFADPLTGEGIYYAIRSGKIAAKQIMDDKIDEYDHFCYKEFQNTLRKSLIYNLLGITKVYIRFEPLRKKLCRYFSEIMYLER